MGNYYRQKKKKQSSRNEQKEARTTQPSGYDLGASPEKGPCESGQTWAEWAKMVALLALLGLST